MKCKRVFFWVLLAVFIGLAAWWIVYFPYNPERLYRAIPDNAVFFSEHGNLAERWKTLVRNPLILGLLSSFGISSKDVDKVTNDPDIDVWVDRFAGRKTLIAYVPSLGDSCQPAWILASWAGGYGQLLKWGFSSGLPDDFTRTKLGTGRQIWILNKAATDRKVSVAVIEGVLLGCLSSDPTAAQYILDRIEKGVSIRPELRASLMSEPEKACLHQHFNSESRRLGTQDRGWISWNESHGRTSIRRKVAFAFTSYTKKYLEGRLKGDFRLPTQAPPEASPRRVADLSAKALAAADFRLGRLTDLKGLKRFLGDAPSAFITMPYEYIEQLLCRNKASDGLRIAAEIFKGATAEDGSIFACLCGGDYSGRIWRIRVPTVMVGVKIKDGAEVLDIVPDLLDALNTQYGWSLIPRYGETGRLFSSSKASSFFVPGSETYENAEEAVSDKIIVPSTDSERDKSLIILDSTRGGMYSEMKLMEKAAIAVKEDWLVFSSNANVLEKLLNRDQQQEEEGRWHRGIGSRDAVGYAWIDIEPTGRALKNLIAVYKLILMMQNTDTGLKTRENLGHVEAWIDAMIPLKTCFLWLDFDGSEFDLRFKLGEGQDGLRPQPKG